jgi:ferredoxin
MVKSEDLCLHCGLCAQNCPTGAWEMQSFLLNRTHAAAARTGADSGSISHA